MSKPQLPSPRGFTLIELLVVISLIAIVLAIGLPRFKDYIVLNRLKAINSQLVTDLQYARTEATTRNVPIYWNMANDGGDTTCYTIYTSENPATECRCLNGPGLACTSLAGTVELKTVLLAPNENVRVDSEGYRRFAFDHINGGLVWGTTDFTSPTPRPFSITNEVLYDSRLMLRTTVSAAGRPSTCNAGSRTVQGYAQC
jgi:type IV fimbrial biogenesis protein FimT